MLGKHKLRLYENKIEVSGFGEEVREDMRVQKHIYFSFRICILVNVLFIHILNLILIIFQALFYIPQFRGMNKNFMEFECN